MRKNIQSFFRALLFVTLLLPLPALADPGNQYCVTPPFITAGIQPNLLLMMDNSASMFDLAYADKGTTTRTPTYCYDNTFSDTNTYAGYFTPTDYYDFDIAAGTFTKIGSFPASGSCTYYMANKYCIALDSATPKRVTKFSCQRQLSQLDDRLQVRHPEKDPHRREICRRQPDCRIARLCRPRLRQAGAFLQHGNYVEGGTNTPIPLTMQVRGENASFDEAAASQGGQTFINFYYNGTAYDAATCANAISVLTDGTSMSGPDKSRCPRLHRRQWRRC